MILTLDVGQDVRSRLVPVGGHGSIYRCSDNILTPGLKIPITKPVPPKPKFFHGQGDEKEKLQRLSGQEGKTRRI